MGDEKFIHSEKEESGLDDNDDDDDDGGIFFLFWKAAGFTFYILYFGRSFCAFYSIRRKLKIFAKLFCIASQHGCAVCRVY